MSGTALAGTVWTRPAAGPRTTKLSPCLVGRWAELDEHDLFKLDGSTVHMSGGAGRSLTFVASGQEVVSYANAKPLIGNLKGSEVRIVEVGVITYHDTTNGSRLGFTSANFADSQETGTWGTGRINFGSPELPAPETFSCTASKLTESSSGYSASFKRS